jgi:hypothetical protein
MEMGIRTGFPSRVRSAERGSSISHSTLAGRSTKHLAAQAFQA